MAVNSIITNNGKKISMYRTFTVNSSLSATLYTAPTQFKVGASQADVSVADTDLTLPIPISTGTVNADGDEVMTGSGGGDNSTDNTTTYKPGANLTDNTSQNLIANDTAVDKVWTIADLSANGANCDATKYIGFWLYIKDATALAKFKSTLTAVEIRIGADSTTNYYAQSWSRSDLAVGWNWLSDGALLSTWVEEGTPGTLNDFQIRITTNNATDEFAAGDVLFDLLRQWEASDTVKDYVSGYPSFDYTSREVSVRCYLNLLEAEGFNIDGHGIFNEDTSALLYSVSKFDAESKSSTDEFAFVVKDIWI